MNAYSYKRFWKALLLIMAVLIVGTSLIWSGNLVGKIQQEERKNVELWAEAIQKRAKLVRYTNDLFSKLREEERKKAELWVKAMRELANSDADTDLNFLLDVVADNSTVPVIQVDHFGNIVNSRNLNPDSLTGTKLDKRRYRERELERMSTGYPPIEIPISLDRTQYLYYTNSNLYFELKETLDDLIESFISETVVNSASVPVLYTDASKREIIAFGNIDSTDVATEADVKALIASMENSNQPIEIDLGETHNFIFYQDSLVLTQLRLYPIVQFIMIFIFILVGYFLFNSARRAEQNQVWVGMSKETAHQLGTPLSSLVAWIEILRDQGTDPMIITELEKDVSRLETITDRFSKIGSTPKLESVDIHEILHNAVNYLKKRTSDKVSFTINIEDGHHEAVLNVPLFEWVIENLSKNAIDAMSGQGSLTYEVSCNPNQVVIDVTDTGKGIPSNKYKAVFQPGFTTKKRGWGLGLSLAKRIIEIYHKGRIFVKWSEVGKGTTFRIILKK